MLTYETCRVRVVLDYEDFSAAVTARAYYYKQIKKKKTIYLDINDTLNFIKFKEDNLRYNFSQ